MSTANLNYSGALTIATCWCGIRHAVPSELAEHQRAQHRDGRKQTGIYCPLGHSYVLSGEGEADRLRRQLEMARNRAQAERDLREHTENKLRAQKGATTKAKKRHAAGVCPVCSRTFQQVQRHMAAKHPDYQPGAHA